MPDDRAPTRIQRRNTEAILDAALEVFAEAGFRGATLDRIAAAAGLSKPNLLYYFPSKEAIFTALLDRLLDTWLGPLRDVDPHGDPLDEILAYVRRKIAMSRTHPRESRLFAQEVLQGAPRIRPLLRDDLRPLVAEATALLSRWMEEERIARVDPHHLLFSIWSLTQHYADFAAQIDAVRPGTDPLEGADAFLDTLYRRLLAT